MPIYIVSFNIQNYFEEVFGILLQLETIFKMPLVKSTTCTGIHTLLSLRGVCCAYLCLVKTFSLFASNGFLLITYKYDMHTYVWLLQHIYIFDCFWLFLIGVVRYIANTGQWCFYQITGWHIMEVKNHNFVKWAVAFTILYNLKFMI